MVTRPDIGSNALHCFHQLYLLGFFYAMRSCENFRVTGERRTKPIRKRDFIFLKNHRILPHTSPLLEEADAVTVVFEYQKRDLRNDSITQSRTGHPVGCPVRASAAIIRRMQSLDLADDDFIFTYQRDDGKGLGHLTSKQALGMLREFIKSTNYAAYGLDPQRIGLHSGRTSAAMAMYLNGIPICTIMLLGRWSSDAFLRYIRKQVEQFSNNVARKMIQRPIFHTIPEATISDPRTHNSQSAAANQGMGSGRVLNRAVFSVWD